MKRAILPAQHRAAVVTRFGALTPLDREAIDLLNAAIAAAMPVPARREVITEHREIPGARIVVSGWAARVRILPDGRRQFLSFLLPGDLIGFCRQNRPMAVATAVALTGLYVCPVPRMDASHALEQAYTISGAIEEANLLAQIARLGRMNALERCTDLLLELYERLDLAGLVEDRSFDFPLTQEVFADMLGLTAVHVNRMVQSLRRNSDIVWRNGRLMIGSPASLARSIGRTPIRVTADDHGHGRIL